MSSFQVLLLSAFVVAVTSIKCNSTSLSVYGIPFPPVYPPNWNYTTIPETFDANTSCTLLLPIPTGYSVVIHYKLYDGNAVTVVDSLANSEVWTATTGNSQRITGYGGDHVTIVIKSSQQVSFSFRYDFTKLQTTTPSVFNISKGEQGRMLSVSTAMRISAETRVSLVPMPTDIPQNYDANKFALVYDGSNENATFLGSYSNFYKRNIVSTGKDLFVVALWSYAIDSYAAYQDYSDVSEMNSFQGVYNFDESYLLSLDATKGPSAIYSHISGGAEYIRNADISKGAIISVYSGFKLSDNSNRLATYTSDDIDTKLPQEFLRSLITIVLDSGTATLNMSRRADDAGFYVPRNGRKGFFSSRNYPFLEKTEITTDLLAATYDQAVAGKKFKYSWNITQFDYSTGASIEISVTTDSSKQQVFVYDKTNKDNMQGSVVGRNMFTTFTPQDQPNQGFFMEFSIENSGYRTAFIMVLLSSFPLFYL